MVLKLAEKYMKANDVINAKQVAELGLKLVLSSLRNPSLSIAAYKQLAEFHGDLYLTLAQLNHKSQTEQALLDYDLAAEIFGNTFAFCTQIRHEFRF